jgi:hypothetical protein
MVTDGITKRHRRCKGRTKKKTALLLAEKNGKERKEGREGRKEEQKAAQKTPLNRYL